MSTVTDAEVEAAWAVIRSCGEPVGAGDGETYVPRPPSKADVLRALEAAEAVRVKASAGATGLPTPTIPEGFIPWHGGKCPVAEGTLGKLFFYGAGECDREGDLTWWAWGWPQSKPTTYCVIA